MKKGICTSQRLKKKKNVTEVVGPNYKKSGEDGVTWVTGVFLPLQANVD